MFFKLIYLLTYCVPSENAVTILAAVALRRRPEECSRWWWVRMVAAVVASCFGLAPSPGDILLIQSAATDGASN